MMTDLRCSGCGTYWTRWRHHKKCPAKEYQQQHNWFKKY